MISMMDRIREKYSGFSAAKRMVAAYFLNHYDSLHYSTLAELAESIGVSDTTIINFCTDLGYSGFSGFKRTIRASIQQPKTISLGSEEAQDQTVLELVNPLVSGIQETFGDAGNDHALRQGAAALTNARRVFAAGFRAQAAIAQEFCLQLRRLGWDASEIVPGMGDYIEKARCIREDDFAVVFDFAPYSKGTMEIVQLLKYRQVPVFLVTDMGSCPCADDCCWVIRCRGMLHSDEEGREGEFGVPAGVLAGYVLRSLARRPEPLMGLQDEELKQGFFSEFHSYGEIETKQW